MQFSFRVLFVAVPASIPINYCILELATLVNKTKVKWGQQLIYFLVILFLRAHDSLWEVLMCFIASIVRRVNLFHHFFSQAFAFV